MVGGTGPASPEPRERGEHANTEGGGPYKPHDYWESGVHPPDEQEVNTSGNGMNGSLATVNVPVSGEHVQGLFTAKMNGQNRSPTRKPAAEGRAVHVFTADDDLDDEETL